MNPPPLTIERLTTREWERLRTIRLHSLKDAPAAFAATLEEAERRSSENWRQQAADIPTFIATLIGRDVGIVRVTGDRESPDTAFLISMWVAPTARGFGVGDALVGAVVDWARNAGFARVVLDVSDENAPAIALYARHGFVPTGESSTLPPPREHVREHRRELRLG